MLEKRFERLAAAGIQLLPALEITTHFVFERGGFIALVERCGDGFGSIGSAGILTGQGMAVPVWRGERCFFVARDLEREAGPAEVEALRAFARDLEDALR
ncbi:MAG: hypothetical protein IT158_01635 [Bryobacterales bacterium]|nr:hypothetical protein [Bryobacterales bacterium]